MSRLFPDESLNSVIDITPKLLEKYNIKGLIIDIDNTLTLHNSQEIEDSVKEWLYTMAKSYSIVLLSNNYHDRVEPFAKMLGLDFIHMGGKPLPSKGFTRAGKMLGLPPENLAVIGDQIFTDILGGNLFGATTIRVKPIQTEGGVFFGIKRFFEDLVMNRYEKRKGKIK